MYVRIERRTVSILNEKDVWVFVIYMGICAVDIELKLYNCVKS